MFNYDPDKSPDPPPQSMIDEAVELKMDIILVSCLETEDAGAVNFYTITPFVPRSGDLIRLEDKRIWQVENVLFNVSSQKNAAGKAETIMMFPQVFALPHKPKQRPSKK